MTQKVVAVAAAAEITQKKFFFDNLSFIRLGMSEFAVQQ